MHIFGSFDSKQLFHIEFWVGTGVRVGMGSVYKLDMLVSKSGEGGGGCASTADIGMLDILV